MSENHQSLTLRSTGQEVASKNHQISEEKRTVGQKNISKNQLLAFQDIRNCFNKKLADKRKFTCKVKQVAKKFEK